MNEPGEGKGNRSSALRSLSWTIGWVVVCLCLTETEWAGKGMNLGDRVEEGERERKRERVNKRSSIQRNMMMNLKILWTFKWRRPGEQ